MTSPIESWVPDPYGEARDIVPRAPYVAPRLLDLVGKELARVLLYEVGINYADTIPIQRKMDR